MNKPKRVYLSPPHMSDEGYEQAYVKEAFDTNWIAPLGPNVNEFENEMAVFTGSGNAVALSAGTAALHLSLIMLDVGPGDEVFCSSFTFSASANVIAYQKATPVFIDSDLKTWNMDPDLLEEALKDRSAKGKRPKAVIVVDLYGQCADYERIEQICEQYGVPLIEDAAEALGATCNSKNAGTFGQFGILSFNGNKIISTSGGGMLLTGSKMYAEKARFLATQARDDAPYYQHTSIGYNYRMSNILAGVGRGQLRVLDQRVKRRREIFSLYEKELGTIQGIDFMPEADFGKSNRWLTCMTMDPSIIITSPEELRLALEEHNIESRPLWKPMHLQPIFESCKMYGGEVSKHLFETGLCLPSGTKMPDEVIYEVVKIIKGTIRNR